jgi:hypothetical protein
MLVVLNGLTLILTSWLIEAYHAYTTTKSTIINYATTEESIQSDDWFREGGGNVRYG